MSIPVNPTPPDKGYTRPNPRFMDGQYELYELTEEQKAAAWENREMQLKPLIHLVWNDETKKLDGRSMEGRSVKWFLSGKGAEIKPSNVPVVKVVLTDDQKQQVEELAQTLENVIDIAQSVFKDETIKPMSRHYRAVWDHYREVFPEGVNKNDEPVDEKDYRAPQTFTGVLGLANRYVTTDDPSRRAYNPNALKRSDERFIKGLSKYIRVYTFGYVASQYDKQVDRELFVSTFVRWAHDKPDLTQIEIDQMISAASEKVNIAQIERSIQRIDRMHEEIAAGNEMDENGKKRKLNMADIELINSMRTKLDQSKGRFKDLMGTLETSRSKRINEKDERNSSITDMFSAWMNDEEGRRNLIKFADGQKKDEVEEVKRLCDLDEFAALIVGQTQDEARV